MLEYNLRPTFIGILILLLVLGLIPIVARVYVRIYIKHAFGWDDIWIVVGWILAAVYAACLIVSVAHGYGRPPADLSASQKSSITLWHSVGRSAVFFGYGAGKSSVAIFLMRIFPQTRIHAVLWFIIASSIIICFFAGIENIVHCNPPNKLWHPEIPGSCWSAIVNRNIVYLGGSVSCFYDWILAILPVPLLMKLHMPRREKYIVAGILSMGVFAGVCAGVKSVYIRSISENSDFDRDSIDLALWTSAEICAINIAACMPTLRPLLHRPLHRNRSEPTSYGHRGRTSSNNRRAGKFSASRQDLQLWRTVSSNATIEQPVEPPKRAILKTTRFEAYGTASTNVRDLEDVQHIVPREIYDSSQQDGIPNRDPQDRRKDRDSPLGYEMQAYESTI